MNPFMYCMYNSINVFIFSLVASLLYPNDQGLGVVLGTDIFNIGFIYALILFGVVLKNEEEVKEFNSFSFMRDCVFYILSLAILTVFLFLN